jgi:leucine dehydrogenase
MDKLDLENKEILGFLAYTLDSLRCHTGPDMGFPTELADKMQDYYSVQFSGGPNGPIGPTGKPTSFGVYLALKEAVRFVTGNNSLDGYTIAIQGLGSIGWTMGEYLLQEDVKLIVTDTDPTMVRSFIEHHPGYSIEAVDPEQILGVKADVFCPSAIGGIITEEIIPQLHFKYIFGGANNQLKATSNKEEIRLANMLAKQGILYQEAWWHNTGGVLAGVEEYEHGKNASGERLMETIKKIVPSKTYENLRKASELGISPTECIYRTCDDILFHTDTKDVLA